MPSYTIHHQPLINKLLPLIIFLISTCQIQAQKIRPDAFPPALDPAPKALKMATSVDELKSWNSYPTYQVYVETMQQFADSYPDLCRLDTIGTSLQGRLILCLAIHGNKHSEESKPEFFYSSTMHGDEVTGYYLMIRLCDSLLNSYGTAADITDLIDHVDIYINPLSNPDGTYHGGNHTVAGAIRYNSNYVDLNRNYPDPFGTDPLDTIQLENQEMIAYVQNHHFLLSANLHGGSEVMNYPWDSFTSRQRVNEHADWWKAVGKRFVDTCRLVNSRRFTDVNSTGVINGGDWYVISNGRQDYFNYYCNIRELTMELSSTKTVSTNQLDSYWRCESHALINYIKEIFTITDTTTTLGISSFDQSSPIIAYPNPTHGPVTVVTPAGKHLFNLADRPVGIYVITVDGKPIKVVKY